MKLFYAIAFLCFFKTSLPLVLGTLIEEEGFVKSRSDPHNSFLHKVVKRVLQTEDCCCCCNNDTSTDDVEDTDDDNSSVSVGDDNGSENGDENGSGNDDEATEDSTLMPSSPPTQITRQQILGNVMEIIYAGIGVSTSLWTQENYCEWHGVGTENCNGVEPTKIDLSNGDWRGRLPTEIGHLTELTHLKLSYNSFGTTIPTELGLLTELEELYFDYNSMWGSIPNELDNIAASLTVLHLNGNEEFSGTIPSSLCGIANADFNVEGTQIDEC